MPQKTILIADDSDQDIQMLLRTIDFVGIQNPIQIVKDGQETIDYFEGEGVFADRVKYPLPGILLLDALMPKVDGLAVLRHLQANPMYSQILIIVLSGLSDNDYIDEAYRAGANSFLRKPARVHELENLANFFSNYWDVKKAT